MYISSATLSFSLNSEQDDELHDHCALLFDALAMQRNPVAGPQVVTGVHLKEMMVGPH